MTTGTHTPLTQTGAPLTAIVTGASAGIGKATAMRLQAYASPQETIVITGRDAGRLSAAEQEIAAAGKAGLQGLVCDQSSSEDVEALCDTVLAMKPQHLQLVANVGWNPVHTIGPKKLQNTDPDIIRQCLEVNVAMTALLIAKLLPAMRTARYGRIVLVGSQAYRHGIPGQVAYNMAKSALIGLSNTVVSEYGRAGLFCHLVEPGIVLNARTQRLRDRLAGGQDDQFVTEDAVAERIVSLLGVDRPDENGQVVAV